MQIDPLVIPLYPDAPPVPGAPAERETPLPGTRFVRNITRPTLSIHLPDPTAAIGVGVLVCPGGAYHFLNWDDEGTKVAAWLNQRGMAAFLLKYRVYLTPPEDADFFRALDETFADPKNQPDALNTLMSSHRPLAVADGLQALSIIRQRGSEWGVLPGHIGMLGFSAGADLTLGVLLNDDPAARLDFAAPIYVPPREPYAAPQDAPPVFIAVTGDDDLLPGSLQLYTAWHSAGRPAEMHIYAQGGHGFGMKQQGLPVDGWIERFTDWLGSLGMLKASAAE